MPLWREPSPLLLASGSATRRDMLAAAGLPVEARSPRIDERSLEAGLAAVGASSPQVAAALARAKALALSIPGRLTLGADQTLDLDGQRWHKPSNRDEAGRQLAALQGRSHSLHSAFALARDGEVLAEGLGSARLTVRNLSSAFIAAYLDEAGDRVLASVGAYQVEGLGAHLFDKIEGDHFTILGLPLLELLAALRRLGSLQD